jgi:hypothetical protein
MLLSPGRRLKRNRNLGRASRWQDVTMRQRSKDAVDDRRQQQ